MTQIAIEKCHDVADEVGPGLTAGFRPPSRRTATAPLLVTTAGLLVAILAAGSLLANRVQSDPAEAVPIAASSAAFPDVGVSDGAYEPGYSSGWHVHPGLHSVVVLEGMLTVLDEACRRQQFRPGETYLGGDRPHVARNEESERLRFAVTYVFSRVSDAGPGRAVSPPACGADLQ